MQIAEFNDFCQLQSGPIRCFNRCKWNIMLVYVCYRRRLFDTQSSRQKLAYLG